MENLTEKEVTELLALCEAATPGPWHWDIRPQGHSVTLTGGRSGWDTVMDTTRWGMNGASLRMSDPEVSGCLLPVHVDAVPFPGRDHHKHWARTINPARVDAAYIAAANPATLRRLLLELQRHRQAPAAAGEAWVAVGDRLPEPNEQVLAYLSLGRMILASHSGKRWGSPMEALYMCKYITYWQPLPTQPAPPTLADEPTCLNSSACHGCGVCAGPTTPTQPCN